MFGSLPTISPGRTNRTRNSAAEAIVPIEQLREHLGLASDDDGQDNIIQSALDAAVGVVESMLHRSLVATDVVDFFPEGCLRLRLSEAEPDAATVAVMHLSNGTVAAGDWSLDTSEVPAILVLSEYQGGDGKVKNPLQVSYTVNGYMNNARTSQRIAQAVKMLVAASYQDRVGRDMDAVFDTVATLVSAPVGSSAY